MNAINTLQQDVPRKGFGSADCVLIRTLFEGRPVYLVLL